MIKRPLERPGVLDKLNSLTKFPSIPTLHVMGDKGRLGDEVEPGFFDLVRDAPSELVATEKVDGTNSRILLFTDGTFLVGSKEELLWYSEDLIGNPAMYIVQEVRRWRAEIEAFALNDAPQGLTVLYLETYGHGIGQSGKQYAVTEDDRSLRLFDAAFWGGSSWWKLVSDPEVESEDLARMRQRGEQPFLSWETIQEMGRSLDIETVVERELPPKDLSMVSVYDWVRFQPKSSALIDDVAPGLPEGVVLRTRRGNSLAPFDAPVRRAKARVEDYRRTILARK